MADQSQMFGCPPEVAAELDAFIAELDDDVARDLVKPEPRKLVTAQEKWDAMTVSQRMQVLIAMRITPSRAEPYSVKRWIDIDVDKRGVIERSFWCAKIWDEVR